MTRGFKSFFLGLCVFVLVFSSSTFGLDTDQAFQKLKDSGEHYDIIGTVCEQVAKLEFETEFPAPQYRVVTGIAYADLSRIIGELDVVVFRAQDENAVLIAEVKCWGNFRAAHSKAVKQRERFQKVISSGHPIQLYSTTKREIQFDKDQFDGGPKFISISQKGGGQAGFDRSLEYSLDELMALREKLIKCQNRGECRRPN